MKVFFRTIWISIHAPREGGDQPKTQCRRDGDISIHAPREGGDQQAGSRSCAGFSFQSTPPARGATMYFLYASFKVMVISIHAPREGGDVLNSKCNL